MKSLVLSLLLAVSAVAQQVPRYEGVPFPNYNIQTDLFWWTQSGTYSYHYTPAVGTDTHTNVQQALSMEISAVRYFQDTRPRQSLCWFVVPVAWFAGRPCDLEVSWWQRTGGSGIFSFSPIYWTGQSFTEGTGTLGTGGQEWVKRTIRIPYSGAPEYGVIWRVHAATTLTSRWAQIDAVSISYVVPPGQIQPPIM